MSKRGSKNAPSRGDKRAIFLRRLEKIFSVSPQEAEILALVKLKSSVRINRLSPLPADEIMAGLRDHGVELEPISWCPDGYFLKSDKGAVVASRWFSEGHAYIQNASSLIPALVLNPKAGDKVLDVCAAPGGKTAHLSALSNGEAEIWANDSLRVKKLQNVLETFHVQGAHLSDHPGQFIDRHLNDEGPFDAILLDAQCSGEGMMNLSVSGALRHWSEERITKMRYLQQKMLSSAWKVLKPGGVLVYSTCTFAPEENEAPISRHLKHHDDATIEPIEMDVVGRLGGLKSWAGETFNPELKHAMRIQPSEFMEGFFVCRLRKDAN